MARATIVRWTVRGKPVTGGFHRRPRVGAVDRQGVAVAEGWADTVALGRTLGVGVGVPRLGVAVVVLEGDGVALGVEPALITPHAMRGPALPSG